MEVEQPPRDPDDPEPDPDDPEPSAAPPPPRPEIDAAEMATIRQKLIVNGRVRLDLEALSIYMLAPSFFAIACMFTPRPWQRRIRTYARRMGVLASRQCGKSLTTAYKVAAFMICHPGTTVLILAPTLRQSSEMLLKIAGILQYVGMKIAALNQFQCALADKQPGAGARVVSLAGVERGCGRLDAWLRGRLPHSRGGIIPERRRRSFRPAVDGGTAESHAAIDQFSGIGRLVLS